LQGLLAAAVDVIFCSGCHANAPHDNGRQRGTSDIRFVIHGPTTARRPFFHLSIVQQAIHWL
jgi:hypothetical protein